MAKINTSPLDRSDIYAIVLLGVNVFLFSILLPTLKFVIFRYLPVPTTQTTLFVGAYAIILFVLFLNLMKLSAVYNEADNIAKNKAVSSTFTLTIVLFFLTTFIEILVSRTG